MADLGLSQEDLLSIFPEVAEKRFDVTKEEKKQLFEEAKEEVKEDRKNISLLPFAEQIPGTVEQEYVESLKEAEKEAVDNKMSYVSELWGEPVENIGFSNVRDLALTFQLSRSKYFKNRQKKFMNYYPDGDYQRLTVDYGDGNTDKLELFKYDS